MKVLVDQAKTSYGRAVVKLIAKRLPTKEHYEELKALSDIHNVWCPSVKEMQEAR